MLGCMAFPFNGHLRRWQCCREQPKERGRRVLGYRKRGALRRDEVKAFGLDFMKARSERPCFTQWLKCRLAERQSGTGSTHHGHIILRNIR